ncbi:1-deoxy-D-xylulose-5-phosphate reductoisomerase [bacterium]|nr:MAG: 1-deoxy-D-xylulose-5-phosphate reductoisomerase [bacterium]
MKKIIVLGSTGSVGKNTIEVVLRYPDRFKIVGLAANNNVSELETQINACNPEVVAVYDESAGETLKKKHLPAEIVTGSRGLIDLVTRVRADMVVSSIVGSAGLMPTLAAIQSGKDIALASKEVLVMAGSIIMAEASKKGILFVPVDSEHSAIFQCLEGKSNSEIKKIILTASGGPFLRKSLSELEAVTPETALKHPNWLMGKKISIDSATLMNKGLEVIEAFWLFNLPLDKIEVLLHPQSIVHSMVEFIDGSVIAQMSVPDMKGPISYALSYPERFGDVLPSLDLAEIGELTFEAPDLDKFRCLSLTYDALKGGGTMPSVLNAANEVAVDSFLAREIPFTDISRIVADTMAQHSISGTESIEDVIEASNWAREKAQEIVKSRRM